MNYQWTLRNGEDAICIFNMRLNNLNEPTGLEPHAPQRIGGPKPRRVRTSNAIS